MAAVRLIVGASLDPAAAHILEPLLASVKRARAAIANEMKGMASDVAAGYRDAPAYAKKGFGGAADEAEKADRRTTTSAQRAAAERAKAAEHVFQVKQRYLQQEERDAEKSARRQADSAKRILSGAAGTFSSGVRGAVGIAGQIARGAGVNFDVGSLVGSVTRQQAAATGISASGYLEGEKGAAGQRQDPAKILAEARSAADAARISTDTALEGLSAFVGKTTDLETGRALLERMAIQSKATGANMADVLDAAGSIAVKMGDIPDKADAVAALMGIIAKQGKVGAVEMKTMAAQIAGFIGPANKFEEGIAGAVTELGTLFQITNKFGGVKGPAQAATSVASFVSDLTSKSGMKALGAAGVKDTDIFADKGKTKLKSLQDIIPILLEKSGGDLTKIAKEMPNKRSKSVLDAFAQIYSDAEKVKKGSGRAAVQETFKTYGGATSQKDTMEALARANATTASKVQLFNNQLEKVAEDAAGKILPAFEKLAPDAVKLAGALGSLAVFVAENPLKAAFIGMGASLAKEFAGAGIKSLVEKALSGGGGVKGAGALGATLVIAAATIAIEEAILSTKEKAQESGQEALAQDINAREKVRAARERGEYSPEAKAALERQIADQQKRVAMGEEYKAQTPVLGSIANVASGIGNFVSAGSVGTSFEAQAQKSAAAEQLDAIKAEMTANKAELAKLNAALTGKTLRVRVENMPAPGAQPGTQTGPTPVR